MSFLYWFKMHITPPAFICDWVHQRFRYESLLGFSEGWEDGYEYRRINGDKYDDIIYHPGAKR